MKAYAIELRNIYEQIPRRHSADNVKSINNLLQEYEDILAKIEATNAFFESNTADNFANLDTIRLKIKQSSDNKASKKNKDVLFDEASGLLKDDIDQLIKLLEAAGNE
jgi:hypothetical protein